MFNSVSKWWKNDHFWVNFPFKRRFLICVDFLQRISRNVTYVGSSVDFGTEQMWGLFAHGSNVFFRFGHTMSIPWQWPVRGPVVPLMKDFCYDWQVMLSFVLLNVSQATCSHFDLGREANGLLRKCILYSSCRSVRVFWMEHEDNSLFLCLSIAVTQRNELSVFTNRKLIVRVNQNGQFMKAYQQNVVALYFSLIERTAVRSEVY